MLEKIQKKFAALESRRKKILNQLKTLPQNHLAVKPGSDKWSIIEVIQHLVLVEQQIVTQADRKPLNLDSSPTARSREALEMVIEILEKDIRVDVPSASMEPDGQITLAALRTQWKESRVQLCRFFQHLNKESVDAAVFSHPVAGSLNALDMLDLANVHTDYHMRQIEGIQRQLSSISSSKKYNQEE